ncbi:MAG TPA: cytochrome c [Methylotenera sp.]|nr:cytochrome c [Methylotenera sp.]
MNKTMNKLLIALLLTLTSTATFAGKEEDQQIKFRQSAYSVLGWSTARIKAQVVDRPETFNKEEVQAAANLVAAIANSGLGKLYGLGTDEGTGWKKTRLKPEFFQKPDEAKKVAVAFNQEANELAKVAATGDAGAIRVQFTKVSESCKACHDSFRIRE